MISRNAAFRESNLPLPSKQTGKVREKIDCNHRQNFCL